MDKLQRLINESLEIDKKLLENITKNFFKKGEEVEKDNRISIANNWIENTVLKIQKEKDTIVQTTQTEKPLEREQQ